MKIVLVHHGEVEEPWLPEMGHANPSLSVHGLHQAEALAGELLAAAHRGQEIQAVYSSAMESASVTAEVICAALELPLPELREELGTLTPEVLPEDGGIDALTLLQERAWSFIEHLRDDNDLSVNFVLVTHELTLRTLICRALAMSLKDLRRFRLDPASLSTLEFRRAPNGDMRSTVTTLNEVCHLE
jgi:broad specificity phosphatase PhoE